MRGRQEGESAMSDIHAVAQSYAAECLETRLAHLQQQHEAREVLLREEIAKWKSHRVWSDRILRAYLDLECLSR